jgi:hypothetical protein
MTAAIFALIGAVIGVLGTALTQLIKARADDTKSRRDNLRLICADFATAVAQIKELACQVIEKRADSDPSAWASINKAHLEARAHFESLRLISSLQVQESSRLTLRYAYGLMQEAEGKPPRDDEEEQGPLKLFYLSLTQLYIAVRSELGIPNPEDVFRDPDDWLGPQYRSSNKVVAVPEPDPVIPLLPVTPPRPPAEA